MVSLQTISDNPEALVEQAGLHRDIERGARNVSLENIEKLAKALEVSISDFFAQYGIEQE